MRKMGLRWSAMFLVLLVSVSYQGMAQTAGKVIFAFGEGTIIRLNNDYQPLKKGAALGAGDEVLTKADSRAQIKLNDGSFFSLRPDSSFKIKSFVFNNDKKTDESHFSLLKGGFRAVTGLIPKVKKSAYSVETPIGTLGVRGTGYEILLVPVLKGAGKASFQLVTHTNVGAISLTNQAGTEVFSAGQSGFISSKNLLPRKAKPSEVKLLVRSGLIKASLKGQKEAKKEFSEGVLHRENKGVLEKGVGKNKESSNSDGSVKNSAKEKESVKEKTKGIWDNNKKNEAVVLSNEADRMEKKVETMDGSSVSLVGDPAAIDEVVSDFRALTYSSRDLSTGSSASSSAKVSINSNGVISEFRDSAFTATSTDTPDETGYDESTVVSWGRWTGSSGSLSASGIDTAIHWATGPKAILPKTGIASYSVVGNTPPTDGATEGTLGKVTLSADFTNQEINTSLTMQAGSKNWNAIANGMDLDKKGVFATNNPAVTVNNTSVSGNSSISGNLTGFNASGAVMSYKLDDGSSSVTGAIGLKRD